MKTEQEIRSQVNKERFIANLVGALASAATLLIIQAASRKRATK